jgi:hypothetical protein
LKVCICMELNVSNVSKVNKVFVVCTLDDF